MDLEKILFVDDDELMAEFITLTLQSIGGFEVMYCSSGLCATDKVTEFMPDLILLDVMMPGMDGIETFNELQKQPSSKYVPVIFLTGKNTATNIKRYSDMGALGVIGKPFNPEALCATIFSLWGNQ